MKDNQVDKSWRMRIDERMASKYPEKKFSDEEALYQQIYEDYEDYDHRISKHEETENSILNMFKESPESASFFSDWHNGKNPRIEFIRRYGKDLLEHADDPEVMKQIEEAEADYHQRVAEDNRLTELREKNMSVSADNMEKVKAELNLSEEDVEAVFSLWAKIQNEGNDGLITEDTFKMLHDAIRHDNDVEHARKEGELLGRNTKITEKLKKPNSDGTAHLGGGQVGNKNVMSRPELGALERYNGNMNIYERGGEKRKPIKN